jgi:hypothetical protein
MLELLAFSVGGLVSLVVLVTVFRAIAGVSFTRPRQIIAAYVAAACLAVAIAASQEAGIWIGQLVALPLGIGLELFLLWRRDRM